MADPLPASEAVPVAEFRAALRRFLRTSERNARAAGLTPQRYLLLLMIKGAADESEQSPVTRRVAARRGDGRGRAGAPRRRRADRLPAPDRGGRAALGAVVHQQRARAAGGARGGVPPPHQTAGAINNTRCGVTAA